MKRFTYIIVFLSLGVVHVGFAQDKDSSVISQAKPASALYETKRDLLQAELQTLAQGISTFDSILSQARLALVTILIAFVGYLAQKQRRSESDLPSKSVAWLLAAFIISIYGTDRHQTDVQERIRVRIDTINVELTTLPEKSEAELASVKTFPSLRVHDPVGKLCSLFLPNLGQVLAYIPLFGMLAFLLVRVHRR